MGDEDKTLLQLMDEEIARQVDEIRRRQAIVGKLLEAAKAIRGGEISGGGGGESRRGEKTARSPRHEDVVSIVEPPPIEIDPDGDLKGLPTRKAARRILGEQIGTWMRYPEIARRAISRGHRVGEEPEEYRDVCRRFLDVLRRSHEFEKRGDEFRLIEGIEEDEGEETSRRGMLADLAEEIINRKDMPMRVKDIKEEIDGILAMKGLQGEASYNAIHSAIDRSRGRFQKFGRGLWGLPHMRLREDIRADKLLFGGEEK